MAALRIGIVGCGAQARKHISGYAACDDVEIVVADLIPDRAHALSEATGVASVDDPTALLCGGAVDAVSICTPTPAHLSQIQAAVATGKHFFCEKPLCETAEQAALVLNATRARGVVGHVGYVYRHVPVFRTFKSILGGGGDGESPVLGRLVSATFRLGGRGSTAPWKHRRETGGGVIPEMLVHMLDLAVWFFGPMQEIELLSSRLLRPRRMIGGEMIDCDADDFAVARLRSASGVEIAIQADMVTPAFSQLVEIQGDNGTMVGSIDGATPSFVFCRNEAGGFQANKKTPLECKPQNYYLSQMAGFVHDIHDGAPDRDDTIRDTVEVTRCLQALSR